MSKKEKPTSAPEVKPDDTEARALIENNPDAQPLTPVQAHENHDVVAAMPSKVKAMADVDAEVVALDAQHRGTLFNDYETNRAAEKGKSDPPKGPYNNSLAQTLQNWLNGHEQYQGQRQHIENQIKNIERKFLDAIRVKLLAKEALKKDTSDKLKALSDAIEKDLNGQIQENATDLASVNRFIMALAQLRKMKHREVMSQDTTGGGVRTEVLDPEEILGLTEDLNFVLQMPEEDMLAMVIEGQGLLAALMEQQDSNQLGTNNKLYVDHLPNGTTDITNPDTAPLRDYFQVKYSTETTTHGDTVNRLTVHNNGPLPGESGPMGVMVNDNHYVELADVVAGNHAKRRDGMPRKSTQRMIIEGTMINGIVGNMPADQREYLTYVVNREYGAAMARDFVKGAILGGTMNVKDLENMAARIPELKWLGEKPMLDLASEMVVRHEINEKRSDLASKGLTTRYVENAVMQYVSPQGLTGLALYAGGIISTCANVLITVMDAVKDGHGDDMIGDIIKGVENSLCNGYVLASGAVAALGRHMLEPFTLADLVRMSPDKRDQIDASKQRQFFNALMVNHRGGYTQYLVDNWKKFQVIAERNQNHINPKQGRQSREYKLYPGDITIDPITAYAWGFKSAAEAEVATQSAFTIANKRLLQSGKKRFDTDDLIAYTTGVSQDGQRAGNNRYKPAKAHFDYGSTNENEQHGNVIESNNPLEELIKSQASS